MVNSSEIISGHFRENCGWTSVGKERDTWWRSIRRSTHVFLLFLFCFGPSEEVDDQLSVEKNLHFSFVFAQTAGTTSVFNRITCV